MFSVTWDLSTGVFFVFNVLYFACSNSSFPLQLWMLFATYLILTTPLMMVMCWRYMPQDPSRQPVTFETLSLVMDGDDDIPAKPFELESDIVKLDLKTPESNESQGGKFRWKLLLSPTMTFNYIASSCQSKKLLNFVCYSPALRTAVQVITVTFFLATVNEQLIWINGPGHV